MPVDRTLHLFFCQRYGSFEFWRLQSVCGILQCSKRMLVPTVPDGNTYSLAFSGTESFCSPIYKYLQFRERHVRVPGD